MPFKIVRNDLTKMPVDVIVNTANKAPIYSFGTDTAVYRAAGEDELLEERRKIGYMEEGEAAITPGFKLPAKYIIHAVSPLYRDGNNDEERKLRDCYRNSLQLAVQYHCRSIAFPLIATGSFGYPREEGMRIALDEINAFLLKEEMLIYLVVFDSQSTRLGQSFYPELKEYIDQNYVSNQRKTEYSFRTCLCEAEPDYLEDEKSEAPRASTLAERMLHMSDTFQEYLLYLMNEKNLSSTAVYKRALVTRQLFSKIKVNPDYHPDKATAMRLCVGAQLNLDETRDLLARAGYALSPCDKRDIIFSFFIEQEIYDMIEIDITLEEYGLPCFIE